MLFFFIVPIHSYRLIIFRGRDQSALCTLGFRPFVIFCLSVYIYSGTVRLPGAVKSTVLCSTSVEDESPLYRQGIGPCPPSWGQDHLSSPPLTPAPSLPLPLGKQHHDLLISSHLSFSASPLPLSFPLLLPSSPLLPPLAFLLLL